MKSIPTTENTLALRTDYSDEAAWVSLCDAIQNPEEDFTAYVDFVSDPVYAGVTAEQLPSLMSPESVAHFAFIIDNTALTSSEHSVLVVDLLNDPGRSFRVILSEMGSVENNLSLANMDFEDFADRVDDDGVFRGFE